ncbi:MAG: hypothetical protein OXF02_01105 [Simkaniaceae bacterium]|nr:hypothetical protein [Simkaniaceae bacterium]
MATVHEMGPVPPTTENGAHVDMENDEESRLTRWVLRIDELFNGEERSPEAERRDTRSEKRGRLWTPLTTANIVMFAVMGAVIGGVTGCAILAGLGPPGFVMGAVFGAIIGAAVGACIAYKLACTSTSPAKNDDFNCTAGSRTHD